MKTKIIPFDLDMAKKIQTGEIKGRIIYNSSEAEILDFNLYFKGHAYVCAKTKGNSGEYATRLFNKYGKDAENGNNVSCYNLILEVPDNKPQFKSFDRVLVRDSDDEEWTVGIFSHMTDLEQPYACVGNIFVYQCIPYAGNENLIGTTDNPKEE